MINVQSILARHELIRELYGQDAYGDLMAEELQWAADKHREYSARRQRLVETTGKELKERSGREPMARCTQRSWPTRISSPTVGPRPWPTGPRSDFGNRGGLRLSQRLPILRLLRARRRILIHRVRYHAGQHRQRAANVPGSRLPRR